MTTDSNWAALMFQNPKFSERCAGHLIPSGQPGCRGGGKGASLLGSGLDEPVGAGQASQLMQGHLIPNSSVSWRRVAPRQSLLCEGLLNSRPPAGIPSFSHVLTFPFMCKGPQQDDCSELVPVSVKVMPGRLFLLHWRPRGD